MTELSPCKCGQNPTQNGLQVACSCGISASGTDERIAAKNWNAMVSGFYPVTRNCPVCGESITTDYGITIEHCGEIV